MTIVGTNKLKRYLKIALAPVEKETRRQSIGREIAFRVADPIKFNILKNPMILLVQFTFIVAAVELT